NDSLNFFVGIAVGNNEQTLINNMLIAQQKYETIVSVDKNMEYMTYNLSQNYPNPFNPRTRIEFIIPTNERVELSVFNLLGEKVETLIDKELDAGKHFIDFDASKLSSGMYFYKIEAGEFTSIKKMVLVK
ncbi:MAG: T9SS type A sorting domain-containing protein, partial [Ignavibacteria bacterium]